MKFAAIALILLLSGCATSTNFVKEVVEEVKTVQTQVEKDQVIVIDGMAGVELPPGALEPVGSAAPSPAREFNPAQAIEKIKEGVAAVKKAQKVFNAVKDALKEDGAGTPVAESKGSVEPIPPMPAPAPQPAPLPAQTGARVDILGMGLEFWVGNNDSWSTVWKLLVLMLFGYGGLRAINFVFDRRKTT